MRALTWQGTEKVAVESVPDPTIQDPTDAIVRVTSTAICGSDLHLYRLLGMYLEKGDVLGHEAMGVVEEVGSAAGDLRVGQRVVVPFTISCGHCWMCSRGLQSQCETTQVREQGSGAEAVAWISPAFYERRFEEAMARDALWYVGYTLAHPGARRTSAFVDMLDVLIGMLRDNRVTVGYDVSQFNDTSLKFARHLFDRARRATELSTVEVDVQTYYAATFS